MYEQLLNIFLNIPFCSTTWWNNRFQWNPAMHFQEYAQNTHKLGNLLNAYNVPAQVTHFYTTKNSYCSICQSKILEN